MTDDGAGGGSTATPGAAASEAGTPDGEAPQRGVPEGGVRADDGGWLSDEGAVVAVVAAACLVLGLLAAADGDTVVAVGPALLAGVYGSALTARDALQGRPPTASDFGGLAAFCAFAAVVAAVDRSYLTAAGLALLALLNAGRWRGWRVEE